MTTSARVIADSISPSGKRITTFELEFHRFILAEFNTHRLLSRNAASSRAIPVEKSIDQVIRSTAIPIHWGKNQPGMSAKEECVAPIHLTPGAEFSATRVGAWLWVRDRAIEAARAFADAGYHKQIVNRLIENFSYVKVVCTATEFDNFFWLRDHPDAQPEIHLLAREMRSALAASTPQPLVPGSWHTPYYRDGFWTPHDIFAVEVVDVHGTTLSDALAISSSCCAQVSYRRNDDSIEKARSIYNRLIESLPPHASPFEHQATPIDLTALQGGFGHSELPEGITHIDVRKDDSFWSGNFNNWIQHRQLIPNNAYWGDHND